MKLSAASECMVKVLGVLVLQLPQKRLQHQHVFCQRQLRLAGSDKKRSPGGGGGGVGRGVGWGLGTNHLTPCEFLWG